MPSAANLISYVPPFLQCSAIYRNVINAQGAEIDLYRDALQQARDQAYVQLATFGLDTWEWELGLPVSPSKPLQERRDKITSKQRGYGTCNIKLVKSVAEAFDQGEVTVVEDFADYSVIIRFISDKGVPSNLDDVKDALRAIIPANLAITYEFTYLTVDDLEAQNITVTQLEAENLTVDQWEQS